MKRILLRTQRSSKRFAVLAFILTGCVVVTNCLQLADRNTNSVEAANGSSMQSQEKNGKSLDVELRINKSSYRASDEMVVEVLLTNRSKVPVYIYRNLDWGESSSFGLWAKDHSSGKFLPQDIVADAITPPPQSRGDFIGLLPDYVYGVTLRVSPRDLGLRKKGTYEIVIDYHSPIPKKFGFGLPIWSKEMGTISSNGVTITVVD